MLFFFSARGPSDLAKAVASKVMRKVALLGGAERQVLCRTLEKRTCDFYDNLDRRRS